MEAYKIKDFNFTYPNMNKNTLSNVDLTIKSGEFVVICGETGSGKSTLIRHLKTILAPHGEKKGEIYYYGRLLSEVPYASQVSEIGYVFQSPDNQIVMDKVWHEMAFGLESLGYDNSTIRLRVAEMASYFGIQSWFYKKVSELSGGEKQILSLAGVMVMQPKVLILDEPTSQLDPIAASDFIETVKKINRELGITIIIAEHRLEDIIPLSDRLVVMDKGSIAADGIPEEAGKKLRRTGHPMFCAMTSAMRIYAGVENDLPCPITVNQGRIWFDLFMKGRSINKGSPNKKENGTAKNAVVELEDVWFRYDKNSPDVLRGLSLKVGEGEFYCILGGNGTGKTTALSVISGIEVPYRGKVIIRAKGSERLTAMLPQNPQCLFVKSTVKEDLLEMISGEKLTESEKQEKITKIADITKLNDLLSMHPYDLSGGEQQRAALAKVLLTEPEILLLDEPTKGLDSFFKENLARILKSLTLCGLTIIMVSHDIEFCAKHGDICALLFEGSMVTIRKAGDFFAGNSFYTTAANRMVRHMHPEAVTVEDVIDLCKRSG